MFSFKLTMTLFPDTYIFHLKKTSEHPDLNGMQLRAL